MLFILNRDFQILGLVSNDSEETLHYYDDTLHTELAAGVSTYEFTVPKNHEDSQFIQEGNYITFKNSKGKQLLFTIIEMEEDSKEKVVYCEDIGLDLLNETVAPSASTTAQPIAFYLNNAMYDSGWEIGVNELTHMNRTLSFDSNSNALERVISILSSFDDAEVDFTVEFDGNTVVHQYLNVYKKVGKDAGIRLNAGVDLVEARRTVSMEGLATALRSVGKTVKNDNPDLPDTTTDITSIDYDDGRYYSELGDPYIRDREANKKWSRFRNGQAQWKGYIVDIYEYDTDSPQELFNRSLSQLKKRCEPAVTYEVDISEIDVNLSIGDTVTIVDPDFKPALYLQARVLSMDESLTDDSKNSIKLGNYVLLKSSVDSQLKELQATLKEVKLSLSEQNKPVISKPTGGLLMSSQHLSKVADWAEGYYQFMEHNTGDFDNLAVNSVGLVGGSYILDNPNTSYTPPSTSTSEAQILTIRGLLRNYIATSDNKWLTKAQFLTTALLRYYYPTEEIPAEIDEQWVPHWLVNVTSPFVSRKYDLNGSAVFENGVATVTYPKVHKIWSVRPSSTIPLYDWTPDPEFNGATYTIESSNIFYGESRAIITLEDKTFNGTALVSYTSETGRVIDIGEKCEAFPVWRPLENGEIACAVDTLPWALDIFEIWHQITGEDKWKRAIECTKEALRVSMSVTNTEYFIKGKQTGETVLGNGITSFSTKTPKETYTNKNGLIVIDYPESIGEASFGTWVGDRLEFSNSRYIEASIGANKKLKAALILDEDGIYSPEKRWRSDIWLSGNGLLLENLERITAKPSDFYDATEVFWGEAYGRDYNGDSVASGQSSVLKTQMFGEVYGKNKPYTNIELTKGDEGGWYGWAQLMLAVWGESLPFDLSYRTDSAIEFAINDSTGTRKAFLLPKTNGEFQTITLTDANFGGLASGTYQSVILEAIDINSVIDIEYIGKLKKFDKNYMTSINFEYKGSDSAKVAIEYIKPAPSRMPLKYAPYIIPFDYHLINYEVSNLRGAIYTGYQAPWIFQRELFEDSSAALGTNLQFLEDSQLAYNAMTGVEGFFAPIYWWNYRDDYGDNEPDTFGMNGNWGEIWGGFQYRTISDVARVFEKEPHNLKAKQIFIKFVKAVDNHWVDAARGFPTEFVKDRPPYNNQTDSHMVTNFLRALLYGLKSENLNSTDMELIYKLIKKSLIYLNYWYIPVDEFESPIEGTWSPNVPNKTWFNYWGGDILDCLGMLRALIK